MINGLRAWVSFRAGIRRPRAHVALDKSPLLLGDVRVLRIRAEVICARLRQAVDCLDLRPGCAGVGQLLEHAMVLGCAVSARLAFLTVRRA